MQAGDSELVLTPPDAFQRLIAHGLVWSHLPTDAVLFSKALLQQCSVSSGSVLELCSCMQASFHGLLSASSANAELETKSVTIRRPRSASVLSAPEVTCADILFALAEQPAGLTPALLAEYTAQHSHERSSEASYVFA